MLRAEDRAEEVLSDTTRQDVGENGYRIEVSGDLDRHAAEVLRLALARLARAEGITLTVTITRVEAPPASS